MSSITHVIFDLDGVLLDTEPLYTESAQRICSRYGQSYNWDIKRQSMGRDARLGARITIETLGLPIGVDEYLEQREKNLAELFLGAPEMPGAVQLIDDLVGRGLILAIATSSQRELCSKKFHGKAWLDRISSITYGDDPELQQLKPEPDIFLLAARRVGARPENCLVFEDSVAGVEAALRANMRVVAMPDPHIRDNEVFERATQCIGAFSELDLTKFGV